MTAFRDLVDSVRQQWDAAVAQAQEERREPVRPTSIYAAGSVGTSDADRARMRQDRSNRDNLYPEGAAPDDQAQRTRRRPVAEPVRLSRTDSRAALMTALRSPASLRTAILVREVLDPPVALRGDSPGNGGGNTGASNR